MKSAVGWVIALVLIWGLGTFAFNGKPDKQPTQEALNGVSALYNEIAAAINQKPDRVSPETYTYIAGLTQELVRRQTLVQTEEVTQKELDEVRTWCEPIEDRLTEIKTKNKIG